MTKSIAYLESEIKNQGIKESTYFSLLNEMHDGVFYLDEETSNIWFNEKLWKLLGFVNRLNETKNNSKDYIHAEDLKTLLKKRGSKQVTTRFYNKAGKSIYCRCTLTRLKNAENRNRILGICKKSNFIHVDNIVSQSFNEEATLSALLLETNDLIFFLDKDLNFIRYYQTNKEDLFYKNERLKGNNVADIPFPPKVKAVILEGLKNAKKQNNICEIKYQLTKDRQLNHYRTKILWLDRQEFVCLVKNVTGERNRELEYNKQKEKLIALLKGAPDVIFTFDEAGYYKEVYNYREHQLAIDQKNFRGKHPSEILEKNKAEELDEIFKKAKKSGEAEVFTYSIKLEDFVGTYEANIRYLEKNKEYIAIVRDISAITESNRQLNLIIDNFPNGSLSLIDKDLKFLYTGGSDYKKFGIDTNTFIGKNIKEVLSINIYEVILKNLPLVERGETVVYTEEFQGKYFSNTLKGIHDDKGRLQYFVLFCNDITKKKYYENAIKKTNKAYKELINSIDGIVWEADPKTLEFYFVSKQAERLLGYPKEKWLEDPSFWPNLIHAEDRECTLDLCKTYSEIGEPHEMEYRMVAKNGKIIWIRDIVQVMLKDGKPFRLRGIMLDVTEKKRAAQLLLKNEQKFENILNTAAEGIYGIDLNGNCTFCNASCLRLLGYEKEQELLGKNMHKMIHHSYRNKKKIPQARCKIYSAYKEGKKIHVKDEVFWKKDKTSFDIEYWSYPMYEENKITGAVVTFVDTTERHKYEKKLRALTEKATQASKAKSEFLANMSHEIRTPLNGVIGFSDLLLQSSLSPSQSKYAQTIYESAISLLEIINDILDFSKIEAGKLNLEPASLDLRNVLEKATNTISYQLQKKELDFTIYLDPDINCNVWSDAVRLKQVLVNLLGNAVKFTEEGEIGLEVSLLKKIDEETQSIRIAVKDSGIGISKQNQKRIFEAFTQEDSSTTKRFGGTGLGLTICNKILSLMRSRLKLKSKLGHGSTFYFDLTLKTSKEENLSFSKLKHVQNVLIIENNANNRKILKEMLDLKNIRCTEVKNGIEAIKFLDKTKKVFEVILIDYHMPYLDGIDTAKYINDNYKHIKAKIILLSSSLDTKQFKEKLEKVDVFSNLKKPLTFEQLYKALTQADTDLSYDISKTREKKHQKPTVLIVEDNEINLLLCETMVRQIYPKATLIRAKNGLEAVKLYDRESIDVVLMDIQMPEMNGYQATKEMRAHATKSKIPIIALTAGVVKGERQKCLAAGMDDFLSKPILKIDLEKVLFKWLDKDEKLENIPITPNELVLNKTHFDKKTLIEKMDADIEFIEMLFEKSKENWGSILKEMKKANNNTDIDLLRDNSHKLKGSSLNLHFNRLAALCTDLEEIEIFDQTKIDVLLENIENEMNYLKANFSLE